MKPTDGIKKLLLRLLERGGHTALAQHCRWSSLDYDHKGAMVWAGPEESIKRMRKADALLSATLAEAKAKAMAMAKGEQC